MRRVNKYSRAILGLFFMGTIVVLLILLRKVISSIALWQDESSTDPAVVSASNVEASIEHTTESATDEIAFDSGNIVALNIVDTVSESPAGEIAASQDVAVSDPAEFDAVQETVAEHETEQMQELEALIERTEAYCVKCREKREMQNARRIVTKNGRNAMEGTCPVCSTRLFRFIAR